MYNESDLEDNKPPYFSDKIDTIIKLKDELYNNRDLVVNHHNIDVK